MKRSIKDTTDDEETSFERPTKKVKPSPTELFLVNLEDTSQRISLQLGLEHVIGREFIPTNSEVQTISDKRLSRRHLEIIVTEQYSTVDDIRQRFRFTIRHCGSNPSLLVRTADEAAYQLERGKEITASHGDTIYLLPGLYPFRFKVKPYKPPDRRANFLFYRNLLPSSPNGALIDEIHEKWWHDYDLLEEHHGYIQWLFPLYESRGTNWRAKKLHKEEARLMRRDLEIARRVVRSYRMMLEFYGLVLVDEQTGEVARASDPEFVRRRYQNLDGNSHNNLRISRIIVSLGLLGFSRYRKPLILFLMREIEELGELPGCRNSLQAFWKAALDPAAPEYRKKTLETEEDSEESVFFFV